jgi:TPR repeat protein
MLSSPSENRQYRLIAALSLTVIVGACAPTSQEVQDQRARSRWQDAAQAGDPEAQYKLARAYCCGVGPEYSTAMAIKWYCESAKRGHIPAQMALADLYSDNVSASTNYLGKPPADFVNAYLWYTVAASLGNPRAFTRRHELGNMMDPADITAAKRLATRWQQFDCARK